MIVTNKIKNFIENNIILLDEGDMAMFLYIATQQLNKTEVNDLIKVLHDSGVDYIPYIEPAYKLYLEDFYILRGRNRLRLAMLLDVVPNFGLGRGEQGNIVCSVIRQLYPNKAIIPDSYGIEYIEEKH